MANGLERFSEVWAEINDLDSPYYLRKEELDRLAIDQIIDQTKTDLAAMCKYNVCRPVLIPTLTYFHGTYTIDNLSINEVLNEE